jgi:hypothetical protein
MTISAQHIREYNMQIELEILNEIPTAVWVSNFEPDDTHFVWANTAALRLWNKSSLQAFKATDIMSGRSVAVKKIHRDLYEDVQVLQLCFCTSGVKYIHQYIIYCCVDTTMFFCVDDFNFFHDCFGP